MRVTVEGIEYEMTVHEPACGFHHFHEEDHPNGSPGQPQHHHHSGRCEERTALLVPVEPSRPIRFEDVGHDGPAVYRERVAGGDWEEWEE